MPTRYLLFSFLTGIQDNSSTPHIVYVECLDILEAYELAEVAAKQALQENDMWSRQLSWYQSEMKKEGIELANLPK